MRVAGEAVEEVLQVLVEQGVARDAAGELLVLGLRRQRAVDQEVGDFEEIALLGEITDGIAAISKNAGVTVDVGDRRGARAGVDVPRVECDVARFLQQARDLDPRGALGRGDDRELDLPARVFQREPLVRHALSSVLPSPGPRCSGCRPQTHAPHS
jgi:hypothetical protein